MDYIKLTPPTPITIPPVKPPGKSRCYPGKRGSGRARALRLPLTFNQNSKPYNRGKRTISSHKIGLW